MVLILYVPGLHAGYLSLFDNYRHRVETLYILDRSVIADYPFSQREIRAITPDQALNLLKSAGYFPRVRLASKRMLSSLSRQKKLTIVLTTEQLSFDLEKRYFQDHKVVHEPIFLRYDESLVKSIRREVDFNGEITAEQLKRDRLESLSQLAAQSSDWFLRVGAALVIDDKVVLAVYNQRQPTPHDSWLVGDPRNFLTYGSDSRMRTCLHAEEGLIAQAAKIGQSTDGAELYVTTFPCPDCSALIAQAGIKTVYFKNGYSQLSSDQLLTGSGVKLIKVVDIS